MAARVIHFGCDDCYRIEVLRSAGFEVRESQSIADLGIDLQRDDGLDAVFMSEDLGHDLEQAAEVARQYTQAPLVVFRRSSEPIDISKFDKVYSSLVPPWIWLRETAALIEQSRALRKESARLRHETQDVVMQSRGQRARSRAELMRNARPRTPASDPAS